MSMIGPKTYIESLKDKSYQELLKEKTELNEEIEKFENNKSELPRNYHLSPSPEVVYQCNLEYMAELCNLIAKKYRKDKFEQSM